MSCPLSRYVDQVRTVLQGGNPEFCKTRFALSLVDIKNRYWFQRLNTQNEKRTGASFENSSIVGRSANFVGLVYLVIDLQVEGVEASHPENNPIVMLPIQSSAGSKDTEMRLAN